MRLPQSGGLVGIAFLGASITVVEFSTALPYLGAIAILTNAELPPGRWLPILVAYNLVFVSPPFLLLVLHKLFGSSLRGRFERLREKFRGGISRDTPLWTVGIVGFLLLRDALCYFDFLGLIPCQSAVPEAYPETGCVGSPLRNG